ncbi:MAG TPA: PepSY domain-containing protein [Chromatiales bacterium]|nr:PepSY domain-containing protein [Chromatiales bacterium]
MRTLHGWLALLFALPLLLASVSGALLGFARESDRMFNVDLLAAPFSASPQRSIQHLLAKAREAHPDRRVIGLGLSTTPVDATLVLMEDAVGVRHEVYIHPRTGELRGSRPAQSSLYGLAWRLHTTLLLDETGRWITRLAALGLLLTTLSGMVLRGRAQARGIAARTHPLLGMTSAPVLGIAAATGLLFMAWQPGYGNVQHLIQNTRGAGLELVDPTPALAALQATQPDCTARWIAPLPEGSLRLACEEPHHAGTLGVRWLTWSPGGLLEPDSRATLAGELLYDLHTGELLGMPGRILWVLASLAIPILILGGLASRNARRATTLTQQRP